MAVEHINETDTLNQGRIKINQIMDQSNASSEKVDSYKADLTTGINEAKQIATNAGAEAKQIATDAGAQANTKADQAIADSKTAVNTANQAVGTANQNKQDFDALRNEFDDLVAESGDSNPEIVQARTDTQGIKQSTLQARLTRDFGNRMTTSEAVQMFSGSVNTPKMMDFNGKTAGNIATNPHQAFSDYTAATLKKPADTWNEVSQENYNKLAGRDDSGVSTGSTQNGVIPQQMYKMNVIEAIKTMAPNIFEGKTAEESLQYVKDIFISFTVSIRGKASSPNNKNLKAATYLESTDSYTTQLQNAAEEYTDFTVEINDSNFIDSTGIINVLVYSDSSNGVTSSNIDIDYVGVQILVSLNPLSVLESSGFVTDETLQKHVNDNTNPHKVTKDQVGLDLVDNYATATQSDAEVGTADNLFMTPLRVFQAIAKWVEGKFVSKTAAETVGGIKNFEDGLQVAGKSIPQAAATTYEKIADYWKGAGYYLGETQSITITDFDNVDEIVITLSRYNANYGGVIYTIPNVPNVAKLQYDILFNAWEGSASSPSNIGIKRLVLSKSNTSLIITGSTINTMNDANKKGVLREVGVRRRK
ncbi:hypothetical protein ACJQ40_002853 [Enterococcus faecium]